VRKHIEVTPLPFEDCDDDECCRVKRGFVECWEAEGDGSILFRMTNDEVLLLYIMY
jgi:hypothetical protein